MNTELKVKVISDKPNTLVNSSFTNGTNGWYKTGTWGTIDNYAFKTPGDIGILKQENINALGVYKVSFAIFVQNDAALAGELTVKIADTSSSAITTIGYHSVIITPTVLTDNFFSIITDDVFNGCITNVSVEKIDGVWTNIDLYNDINVPINYSIAEVQDVTKKNSAYSKTIELPGTINNNQLFEHIYNISTSGAWDFNASIRACLVQDSNIILEGELSLESVSNQGSETIYEVIILQDAANLYSAMGGRYLAQNDSAADDIDFSEYNHILNTTNVVNSWDDGNPVGEGYVYIPIDKTNKYSDSIASSLAFFVQDLTPCVFIKQIFDKILDKYGFSYTSTFLNEEMFGRLIYPHTDRFLYYTKEESEAKSASLIGTTFTHTNTVTPVTPGTGSKVSSLVVPSWIVESQGALIPYNTLTGIYTCPVTGYYSIDFKYIWKFFLSSTDVLAGEKIFFVGDIGEINYIRSQIQVIRKRGGVETIIDAYEPVALTQSFWPTTGSYVVTDANNEFVIDEETTYQHTVLNNFIVGDEVYVKHVSYMPFKDTHGTYLWKDSTGAEIELRLRHTLNLAAADTHLKITASNIVTEGGEIRLNRILHKIKQADFISSITKMFNLYWQPTGDKSFRIEPRDDFYLIDTTPLDWTNKLALDREIKIEPASEIAKTVINFSYTKDTDHFNTAYSSANYERIYGSQVERQPYNKNEEEETKIELVFAPTPCAKFSTHCVESDNIENAKIFQLKDDGSVDYSKKFKPRILYYSGCPVTTNNKLFYVNGVVNPFSYYPHATHLDGTWAEHTADFNFGFCNWYWLNSGINWVSAYNLYSTYYKKMIAELTHPDSKLVTCYLNLTIQDITQFKFWNIIFIDGIYYRVNKIYEFIPNELTKVELLQIQSQTISYPTTTQPTGVITRPISQTINSNTLIDFIDSQDSLTRPTGNLLNVDVIDPNIKSTGAEGILLSRPSVGSIALDFIDPDFIDPLISPATLFSLNSKIPVVSSTFLAVNDSVGGAPINPFNGGDSFTFEWTVPNTPVVFPSISGFTYTCDIDWGDGTVTSLTAWNGAGRNHTYSSAGTYTVKVIGTVNSISFYDNSMHSYLNKVLSWGNVNFIALERGFSHCTNLTSLPNESGKLSQVAYIKHCFRYCTSLTSIPSGLFDGCSLITEFGDTSGGLNGCFYFCTSLTSIPSGLFDDCVNASSFNTCFAHCTSLTSIPAGLFDNTAIDRAIDTFWNCSSLTSIPVGLFNNTSVTLVVNCFVGCTGLTTVKNVFKGQSTITSANACFSGCSSLVNAENCFENCLSLVDIGDVFNNCTNLTNVWYVFAGCPALLSTGTLTDSPFANCPNILDFTAAFYNCLNLTTVTSDLFTDCVNATTFRQTFWNCQSLTSLPANLFASTATSIDFYSCFQTCSSLTSVPDLNLVGASDVRVMFRHCTSLTTIDANLFAGCSALNDIQETFYDCALTSIPSGLFDDCTSVTSFYGCFGGCSDLVSIPAGLFDYNTLVTGFDFCFQGCFALTGIPAGLFDNNVNVISFVACFSSCGNNLVGNAPTLWIDFPTALGTQCFYQDFFLTNYAAIPAGWK